MARYLVYTSPGRSHLYPIVPTLEELGRRGHEVVVRTRASEVGLLRELGFEAESIDPAKSARSTRTGGSYSHRRAAGQPACVLRAGQHEGLDLRGAIEKERPDVLLIDINTWGAMAAAETSGLPWATWFPYLPVLSRDAPPFGLGPARRARAARAPARSTAGPGAVWDLQSPGPGTRRRARAARRAAGAEDRARYGQGAAHALHDSRALEYPRLDWPASLRMVGPGIWDPPAKSLAWLEEVRRPLVLVTCSTEFQNDGKPLQVAWRHSPGRTLRSW